MELTAPDFVKHAVSKLEDLETAADDAARAARHAGISAMKLGRSSVRDARSLVRRHPQLTAAIAGGAAVLAVAGLIAWLRD